MRHGAIVECGTHKRKRSWKTKVSQPKTKCPLCWAVWLSDRLECSLYEDDFQDLIRFSNAFTTVVKPSGIEFIETAKDE
jgi:hypothetical protein